MTTLRNALRAGRLSWPLRGLLWTVAFSLAWLQVSPAYAAGHAAALENARVAQWQAAHRPRPSLPIGLTQTPDPALWQRIEAKRAAWKAARRAAGLPDEGLPDVTADMGTPDAFPDLGGAYSAQAGGRPGASVRARLAARPAPRTAAVRRVADARHRENRTQDVRVLTAREMAGLAGRGQYRNPYYAGPPMPWQRSFHDVNLCTGNLFKSFTDVQIAPARGAGLVLQRTYNSQEARIGPFGVGWTHAYDIRIQEAADVKTESGNQAPLSSIVSQITTELNGQSVGNVDTAPDFVPRTDFFGAKRVYHRDADGLYSSPNYSFDEMSSDYDGALVGGPTKVMADTDKGEDGTVKHYVNVLTLADGTEGNERACDYIQDRYGNKTTLSYGLPYVQADGSTRKLLTQVTDPSGRSLVFSWQNFGTAGQPAYRIVQVQGPLSGGASVPGVTYRVTYDYYLPGDPNAGGAAYQLKAVHLDADGLNRTMTYTYTSYTDGQGNVEPGLLASISDPLGHTVSYDYLNSSGAPNVAGSLWCGHVTEPAGQLGGTGTARTLTWSVGTPGGLDPRYGMSGDQSDCTFSFSAPTLGTDAYGRVTGWKPQYSQTDGEWRTAYDTQNNVTLSEHVVQYLGPPQGNCYTYGAHGNVLEHWVPGFAADDPAVTAGKDLTTWYNASQYFQKANVADAAGHLTAMTVGTSTAGTAGDPDPNGGDRGQVLTVQDAGYAVAGSPSYGKQFTYTYNQYGQKSSETNLNGVVTQYTYGDQWGNLTQVVQDPGAGHLNRTTTMSYDAAGRVLQSTDPAGQTSVFTYNTLGQPLTVATPAKGAAPAEAITYGYDGNGRTLSVRDNRGTTTMAYEAGCDRVSSVTDPVTGTTGYTYFQTGERKTVTLAGGGTWTYAYAGGYLVEAKDDPSGVSAGLASITDDQGRRVDMLTRHDGSLLYVRTDQVFNTGGSVVSYVETDYAYDSGANSQLYGTLSHGWVTQVASTWHGRVNGQAVTRVLNQNAYTYDVLGQRLTNAVSVQPVDALGNPQVDANNTPVLTTRTEKYQKPDGSSGYDALNRLTNVDYGDGQTQSYTFDAMGNRLSRQDSVSGTTNSAYNAANMLLSTSGAGASGFQNDADGNTLSGNGRANAWDSQNRLVSCILGGSTSTFKYGADGLRRQKTAGGATTDYAYDGTMMVREGHAAGGSLTPATVTATYLIGPQGPEYRRDDTQLQTDGQGHTFGKTGWYVYDGLGSVVGEVDPGGNLTSSPKYDVYGAVRANGGTASTRQGFVGGLGHVSDAETGLVYMQARYMDPSTGRFISQDPGRHGLNWFIYTSNNPVNRVDSDGKMDMLFWERALKDASDVVGDAAAEDNYANYLNDLADGLAEEAAGNQVRGRALVLAAEQVQDEAGEDPEIEAMAGAAMLDGGELLAASAVAAEDANQLRILAQLVNGPENGLLN